MTESIDPAQAAIERHAERRAAQRAERPDATPEAIERARQAGAARAAKIIGIKIEGDPTDLRAQERHSSAEVWRQRAVDLTLTDQQRAEAVREAEVVQWQGDNLAGVNNPNIRPAGYEPMTDQQLTESTARVQRMRMG